ncbi:NAD(P)-binding protein [Aspergillus phoenicis ATCC 13157]|uniref:NAD(P)-binding protein n=1 Tax=Aspergillus phoenicis ATCC 13157 TaxID=1353007 RepID=A0A370PTY0_ASPPH|nr:hypothetical protein CBS147346_3179 [Aspergillus niger]RDK45631.1 NAD(P)-binding protein [Aspergillus phoenicis ATCC 13157]
MPDTQRITGRALVSHGPYQAGGWKLQNVSLRPLRENELLIEVVASGVCQTDLHFAGLERGHGVHYPRVMGHEANRVFWGTAADVSTHSAEPEIFGQFFGQSSFASWTIVQEESVVNVSGLVKGREDLQLLAPLGCGVQTGAGAVIKAAKAQPEDTVAVLGLGGVGLSAVMGARIAGCRKIIGIARNQARLELALALGATHVVRLDSNTDKGHVTESVRALTNGLGADVTLETTGVPGLIAEGIRMTANKGRIVQLGTAPEDAVVSLPIHDFMVAGKQYMGVVEGDVVPREFVPKMIEWVKTGLLPLDEIVGFYQAEDYRTAINDMKSGKTIKPILLW